MGKRRQKKAINGEFQLPEPIIHRVQSFLTAKEAAQTAILSKSWCSAWSTRPNIDLDPDDLVGEDYKSCDYNKFKEFAKKTIQRYEQSNLKIESFKISSDCPGIDDNDDFVDDYNDFVNEMITRALKIGATRIITNKNDRYPVLVLTHEVFEAENLIELSVTRCKIDDLGLDQKVRCSKLESLSLNHVEINSAVISSIALCCPLIEKLSLCYLNYWTDADVDETDYLFLSDLSSKFPSLKDLTLSKCNAKEVSSRTLERLKFSTYKQPGLSVKFDVPSIRKFIFDGRKKFPSFSFVSVSREWESDVSFFHYNFRDKTISTSWFRELNKFLTVLSLSKIRLSLDITTDKSFDYAVGDIQGLTRPEVENISISVCALQDLSCYALFDGLFRICLPKVLTQKLCPKSGFSGNKKWDYLLCKTLVRALDEKCMYGLQDLEEVNVQLFAEDVHAWRPLTLESLKEALSSTERCTSFLNDLVSPKDEQEIRFQLKWKTQNAA